MSTEPRGSKLSTPQGSNYTYIQNPAIPQEQFNISRGSSNLEDSIESKPTPIKAILAINRLKEASLTAKIKTPHEGTEMITDYGYGYKTMEKVAP